jgi:predicted lipoprotein with Yx(FWY)xxD motif
MSIPKTLFVLFAATGVLALAGCAKKTESSASTYGAAQATSTVLTAQNGMTLYVFDKDKDGRSACYDKCAENGPPYIGTADDKLPAKWKLVKRTDGTTQWSYNGKPVYFFKEDLAAGDANGDGKGGVWHIVNKV